MNGKRIAVFMLGLFVFGLVAVPAIAAEPLRGMERSNEASSGFTLGMPPVNAIFVASANGFAQVPAVLTHGNAFFRAWIVDNGNAMEFELRFDLAGPLESARLHIGQPGVNGAPAVVLCMPQPPGPSGNPIPICPEENIGVISGVFFAQDILPAAAQQGVHDLETLFAAMASRITYVDVWTGFYQNHGEVRGQVAPLRLADGGGHGGPGSAGPGGQDVEPN